MSSRGLWECLPLHRCPAGAVAGLGCWDGVGVVVGDVGVGLGPHPP